MKNYSIKTASPVNHSDAEQILGANSGTLLRIDSDGKTSTVYFSTSDPAHADNVEKAFSKTGKVERKDVAEKDVFNLH